MSARLEGKVALVTGSTAGIGEAIASLFAQQGAKVIVTGRNSENGLRVVEKIKQGGFEASYIAADLGDESSVKRLAEEAVAIYGKIDTLVNNAAATALTLNDKPITDISNDIIDGAVSINIYGLIWTCKYVIPHIVAAGGGSVVNISTGAALGGVPGMTAYTATKGAMNSLSRALAREYGRQSVRVNCISSGLIESNEETQVMLSDPNVRSYMENMNCLPYFGKPEDTANACVFLASDEARYVTGATLAVDGGAQC